MPEILQKAIPLLLLMVLMYLSMFVSKKLNKRMKHK